MLRVVRQPVLVRLAKHNLDGCQTLAFSNIPNIISSTSAEIDEALVSAKPGVVSSFAEREDDLILTKRCAKVTEPVTTRVSFVDVDHVDTRSKSSGRE